MNSIGLDSGCAWDLCFQCWHVLFSYSEEHTNQNICPWRSQTVTAKFFPPFTGVTYLLYSVIHLFSFFLMTVHLFINIVIHVLFIYLYVCLFTCAHMYICMYVCMNEIKKHSPKIQTGLLALYIYSIQPMQWWFTRFAVQLTGTITNSKQ